MRREEWRDTFHQAGLRLELADLCARIVVQKVARMRSEEIAAARKRGLSLRDLAMAFGLSVEGVRQASTRANCDLTEPGSTLAPHS